MAYKGYQYNSYRGRSPLWKKIAAALLILVILAAGLFIFLQDRLVYDDSGNAKLPVPGAAPSAPAVVDPGELSITVEEAPAEEETLLLREVSARPLTAAAALPEEGVVLTVKDAMGRVYWPSAAAGELGLGLVRTGEDTAAALAELTESGRYTVARLTCLQDPLVARSRVEDMGLKNTGGYIFYDGENMSWLDPAKPAARQYLCALAAELEQLGFDEILLADLTYPTKGKLDKIDYGEALKSAALAELVQALRQAVSPEVKISLELPAETILAGSDPAGGPVLTDLAPLTDRIWAATTAAQAPELAETVRAASETTAFMPEVADAGDLAGSYLLLSGE